MGVAGGSFGRGVTHSRTRACGDECSVHPQNGAQRRRAGPRRSVGAPSRLTPSPNPRGHNDPASPRAGCVRDVRRMRGSRCRSGGRERARATGGPDRRSGARKRFDPCVATRPRKGAVRRARAAYLCGARTARRTASVDGGRARGRHVPVQPSDRPAGRAGRGEALRRGRTVRGFRAADGAPSTRAARSPCAGLGRHGRQRPCRNTPKGRRASGT